jgi:hypothetical protein
MFRRLARLNNKANSSAVNAVILMGFSIAYTPCPEHEKI